MHKSKKLLIMLLIILITQLAFASVATAAVKYSDWRNSTPTIFSKSGSEWTQVLSGGYNNSGTYYISYPAHGWTYAQLSSSREQGDWKLPSASNFWYGELQAYITSSGTHTRAYYYGGSQYRILNQYTSHGWVSLITNAYYYSSVSLNDYHDGYNWWSGQKADFDAIRVYY